MNDEHNNSKIYKHSKQSIARGVVLQIMDLGFVSAALAFSILARFDFSFIKVMKDSSGYWGQMIKFFPFGLITIFAIYHLFKLYSSLWRFAGSQEMVRIGLATFSAAAICQIEILVLRVHLPRSYCVFLFMFLLFEAGGVRFFYRMVREVKKMLQAEKIEKVNTMIIGAGKTGEMLVHEMQNNYEAVNKAVCLIDNNPLKIGKRIHGVPIVGNQATIPQMVHEYGVEEIIISIPSASAKDRKEIIDICKQTHCKVKLVPSMYQLLNEDVSVSRLKDIDLEDLLGREVNIAGNEKVEHYVKDKVVMVTGGGGSIGSELCRQIASYHPKQLIIVDNYENNAYAIQMELIRKSPELDLRVLICTVQNRKRIRKIFREYQPQVVFHAAAHKHVPLMEDSPCDAVKNNCFGTYNVAKEAGEAGVERMVLISTDKAVRPTNVMGATKRICELVIQYNNAIYPDTEYMAVRFGNVLGSNGSVVPLFRRQIAAGGPVTVTHPDIIRYFMTIPEAVSLVLEAGSYLRGGTIFLLDMGEPVKILDMAENLIRLSGYEPYEDIDIEFTGLRPGEKLYEELLIDEDNLLDTDNNRIKAAQLPEKNVEAFERHFAALKEVAFNEDEENIRRAIKKMVPEYRKPEEVNGQV